MTNKYFPQQIVCSNGLYLQDIFLVCRAVALRSESWELEAGSVAVSSAVSDLWWPHLCPRVSAGRTLLCVTPHIVSWSQRQDTFHLPRPEPPPSPPLCQLSALRSPPSLPEPSQPALTDHSDSHGCGSESGSERLCPNLLLRPRPCPPLTLVST